MHSKATPDLSVYQLALGTLTSPQSFSASPTTLNSLVGALIDVLIDAKIPATLWVKYPPTAGWQAEVKQYQQQVGVTQTIYLCNCFEDDLAEVTNTVSPVADGNGDAQIFPVYLAGGSQLKQEYFLIVLSEQLSGLIVAAPLYQSEPIAEASESSSQPLQAICTFERQVIQQVLEGIKGLITVADSTPSDLLERWETLFSSLSASDDRAILTQLLVKQVQRSEAMLHSPTVNDLPSDGSALDLLDTATPIPVAPIGDLRNRDELMKRVAQELRTPLSNMKTALRLLDATPLKSAQRQRYMQLLYTECDRQNSVIAGLLELVQLDCEPQPTVMPSVQLADIVPGVVSTYRPLAQEKGIQLGCIIPVGLPSVSCLESWLRIIVINLLHNSLKFTYSGGQVGVRATLQGKYIRLTFDDTGIGIAVSEIPKIFDSFYRGRPTTGEDMGAGLGLTIVQQLLRRCGGSISVTSKLGEGSSFKVLLPVASPTSAETNL